MLNSGKKIALCPTKKINIPTLVLSGKKNLNEKKHHKPSPLQVKWSVPKEAKEAHWIWKNKGKSNGSTESERKDMIKYSDTHTPQRRIN